MQRRPARAFHFVVPGDIGTVTGGYIYDRRILAELAEQNWQTTLHALDGSFPTPTEAALADAGQVFAAIPEGCTVVIDGLALGGLADVLEREAERLRLIALVHHPLALETGIDTATETRLRASERASLAQVRHVFVTSPWTRLALADYGIADERVTVIEPGTDPAPPRRAAPGRPLRLLCVASLTPRKGYSVLFDALAELADRAWHLRCAGSLSMDVETATALERQIEALDLGDRITLLGEVAPEQVGELYLDTDLFVLASFMEGYGMALAEATARAVPIVSTTAGAIPHTVDRAASRLVPPGDSAALAESLASLMDDPRALEELAEAALAARARLPTWPDSARRFGRAIEAVSA